MSSRANADALVDPPLDVSYARMSEWLQERRMLPMGGRSGSGWRERVGALRARAGAVAESAAGHFPDQVPSAMPFALRSGGGVSGGAGKFGNRALGSGERPLPDYVDCRAILTELRAAKLAPAAADTGGENEAEQPSSSSLFSRMSSAVGLSRTPAELELDRLRSQMGEICAAYETDALHLGEAALIMVQVRRDATDASLPLSPPLPSRAFPEDRTNMAPERGCVASSSLWALRGGSEREGLEGC